VLTEVVVAPEGKKWLARAVPGVSLTRAPRRRPRDLLVVTPLGSALTALARLSGGGQKGKVVVAMFAEKKADLAQLADAFAYAEREHCTPFFAKDPATARRLILAHQHKAADKLIASASVNGDELVVWSCEPKQYVVPLRDLPGVRDLPEPARHKLTLDADGSRLHWREGDVDLDLDAVRYACDPAFKKQQDRQTRASLRTSGSAIQTLRKLHHLKQSQIKGLTDRQVRRIEAGRVIPHASTLEKLAVAHGMSLDAYLSALAALA
jgi:hypothetical protein